MKKIIIILLLFLSLVITVRAEEIKSFDSEININKDGTINVKETINYDFGDIERHGIFRNIPFVKTNQDGKRYRLDFSDFVVTDENNYGYRFSKSTTGDNIQLKIGDPDRTISGVHTYAISYIVSGALTYFSDHDELYWNITGNQWDVPIMESTTTVLLPKELLESEVKAACYTGIYKNTESSCNYYYDRDKYVVNSTRELNPNEGLTVVIGFPIDLVAHLEPKEIVNFWDTLFGRLVAWLLGFLALIWYVFLPFFIVYRWWTKGRDPSASSGQVQAWFDPPKSTDGKRFLTPGEVGTLGDETVDLKDLSATIVDLARRGYIKISEKKKNDYYLEYLDGPHTTASVVLAKKRNLLEFEKLLLDKFFELKKEIRLKDEQLYEEVEEIKKSLYEQTVTDGLFPKNPQSVRTKYYVLAGIALFTGNFSLAITAFIFGRVMPRKTVDGVNAFNVSKSLKNFLSSQERQLTFQADKQMMFEKLLPYAIAFGVEKIWAKRFQDLGIRQPDWYKGYNTGTFNSYLFMNSLNSSMKSFRASATPTKSSSGFSSGFSGGGFSGGGGGGGGGGSW